MPKNYTKEELENGRWITINGVHRFVPGETPKKYTMEDDKKEHPNGHEETIRGYKVWHYYDGDVPVYDIFDKDGNFLDTADSTTELRDIILGYAED